MSSSKAKTFYDIDIDGENESPVVVNSARSHNEGYSHSSIRKSAQLGQLQKSASTAKRLDSKSSLVTLQHQQSQLAVKIENVAFSYKKNKPILKNITLFVPEGTTFALLGSNGCGKTTLLRSILGRLKPNDGLIRVFGIEPGSRNSRIPGPGVGYMPQDISLIPEFNIEETLRYFGQIYHMSEELVNERIEKLVELLNLPDRNRLVRQLSGGQKRLVSLAVTLIHKPPLVILDEPTVGVDSVLRYRIWNHLDNLCKMEGTTVIITTHYIEEAKEAHNVSFLESGSILAQSTPAQLQEKYNCTTLEEVFLKLCIDKYSKKNTDLTPNTASYRKIDEDSKPLECLQIDKELYQEATEKKISFRERLRKEMDKERLKAMIWKSYIRVKRNPFSLIMFHAIPVVTITLFTLTFLRSPHKMPLAIYPGDRTGGNLSQLFINNLDNYFLQKSIFPTEEMAIDSVKRGKSYYAMIFSDNFTEAFTGRYIDVYRSEADEIDIDGSKIRLYPDNSNFIFAVYMQRAVLNYFEQFMRQFSVNMGYNPITFNIPIDVKPPVYGKMETDLGHYLVSALIVFALYTLPMVIGSLLIVMDRKDGYQERAFVAGVRPLEILSGHMLTCFFAVVTTVFITIMLAFVVFGLENKGSLLEIFILIFLQGIQGLSIGLLISMVCVDEIFASIAVISLIIPMLLSSGSMWPMEGLPEVIQKFVFLNPITLTIRSVRLVMLRGWDYTHFQVLIGYITTSSYTATVFVGSIFIFTFLTSNTNIRIPFIPQYH